MSIVSIGDFTVDLKELRVFAADTELTVEPKVVDVLCYLIEHNSRYVSLAELHDNVWAGRVVTDTAVRRTISKLRVLLDDTDAENPQYIKSQMKRGYQLICSVSTEPDAGAAALEVLPVGTDNNVRTKLAVGKPVLVSLVIAVVVIAAIYYFSTKPHRQPLNQLVEIETLLSIPGQKSSLTISKDGRFQAFVAKINNANWELFLYDSAAGQLQKIATPPEHCRFVSFIDNDTRLAYVGYDGSQASLYTQSVLNLNEAPVIHPTFPFNLLGRPIELADNEILIDAAGTFMDNFHYYKYDLIAGTFEQFTYSSESGVQDVFASLSPNKQLLALGRFNNNNKHIMLQVYRIADKELIAEHKLWDNQQDFRLSWQDNDRLLTRIDIKHYLINVHSGELAPVITKPVPLYEFSFTDNGELYGLSHENSRPIIHHASWPLTDNFNKSYQLGNNARQLSFSDSNDNFWLVEKEDSIHRLYRYSHSTNVRKLVMESVETFSIQDQTADSSLLLIKRDNRLEIFNTLTAEFTSVSVSTQDVWAGNFSQTDEDVYFTERVKDQWLVKRYNLVDKTQSLLLQDHMFIQDIADGYIAADSSGNIWRLDQDFNKVHILYQGVDYSVGYQIVVRNNQLIIVFLTMMWEWVLAEIHLTSQQSWQRGLPYHEFNLPFSIDSAGQNLIFKTNIKEENQLVKYSYDFAGK